ncbi:sulfotransferase [Alteromonas sp. 14N.309.X.WAT.G.H12]|uniref:sulfotransferase n=1 Tax=Alteromonas sp. 14N.309.X.WAT.G.H12 TaxID=3120824 RepID=UPI002FCFADA0
MNLSKLDSILVTGFFRTGSTLIFSALRQCPDLQVFYEPYHPDIVDYVIACQNGKATADRARLGHTVEGDYFEEYRNIDIDHMQNFFNKEARTLHHPILEATSSKPDLFNYVDFLHNCAKESGKIPVLQANRFNLCLSWFSARFPNNYNILITRKPRQIFYSLKKLAFKEGLSLNSNTIGLDYWNVLSIFNSLCSRYSFIDELYKGYYYKLCFVVEWINRIESNKADLVLPYEFLPCSSTNTVIKTIFNSFSCNTDMILDYISNNYFELPCMEKSEELLVIENTVEEQINGLITKYFHGLIV